MIAVIILGITIGFCIIEFGFATKSRCYGVVGKKSPAGCVSTVTLYSYEENKDVNIMCNLVSAINLKVGQTVEYTLLTTRILKIDIDRYLN